MCVYMGPLFACEGVLMGVGGFGYLAGITCTFLNLHLYIDMDR